MIYGMITRVSLGHTGRRLHPDFWVIVGYYAQEAAALVRVAASLIPEFYTLGLRISGSLWVLAFLIFLWIYFPMLSAPRIDGKEG
jgi:uncharacterized protein involved in response to NO